MKATTKRTRILKTISLILVLAMTLSLFASCGKQGEQGPQGVQGEQGPQGIPGENGADGADGKDGVDGQDGADGETPYIGENGNWWIGTQDTGIQAAGEKGNKGDKGNTGSKGEKGDKGDTGAKGEDGVSVTGAEINANGELIFTFSNGQTINVGKITDAEYTVAFDLNYEEATDTPTTQNVKSGNCAVEPSAPVRGGYVFVGWYSDKALTIAYNFSASVTANIILYAKWKSDAEVYYETNAELIDVIDVKESEDVLNETEIQMFLGELGFNSYPVTYDFTISGEYVGDTEIQGNSSDKHPMYQSFYINKNNEVWVIYVINGEIYANPISFNLESDLNAPLIISESEILTSYDDATNKYYVSIPNESEILTKTVIKIDTEMLDNLTISELNGMTGASVPSVTNSDDIGSESALTFSNSTDSVLDDDLYINDESVLVTSYSTDLTTFVVEDNSDPFIVVSLGDSYSSGEGITPFYGQEKWVWEKVEDEDWLAHRSTKSWSSLLTIPGIMDDETLAKYRVDWREGETSEESIQWYFGASSGAETWHFQYSHNKPYYQTELWQGEKDLPPQLDVFNYLASQGLSVDIVTLTIGGNDVKFAEIIKTAAMKNDFFWLWGSNKTLENSLNDLWNNIDVIMGNIEGVYDQIQSKVGEQTVIIVAGYPKLLDESGSGFLFDENEAKLINEKVTAFNEKIKNLVEVKRINGMNIYFVDVETEFDKDGGHAAYSEEEWIHPVKMPSQSEDLKPDLSSAYSIHPNEEGAKAYARCVNETINAIWTSDIIGTVSGLNGIAVDAKIEIRNLNSSIIQDAVYTNSNGDFRLANVPKGTYEITISAENYISKTINVTVQGTDGNDIDDPVDIGTIELFGRNITGVITIADADTDMTNNIPLQNALVSIEITGYMSMEKYTSSNGEYVLENIPVGTYKITVSKEGYISVVETIRVTEEDADIIYNIAIEAISEEHSGIGYASGVIYDVGTGGYVQGITLNVRANMNNTTGPILQTLYSDQYGQYSTLGLEAGNYTIEVVDNREDIDDEERYTSTIFNVKVLGDTVIDNQNGYISNGVVSDDYYRVVLTWGENPEDLDSHLIGELSDGNLFHIAYYEKDAYEYDEHIANLDVDDTSSYGPETVTFTAKADKYYRYFVHHYSGYGTITTSGAKVEVYRGNQIIATYNAPTVDSGSLYWHVFEIENGVIKGINQMSDSDDNPSVSAFGLLTEDIENTTYPDKDLAA